MEQKKLVESFVAESLEKIADLESGLLSLEKNPDDVKLIDRLFRDVHTVKGTSGSLELFDLQKVSHVVEEVLDRMRTGKLRPSREVIDVLLNSTDELKTMVEALSKGEAPDPARALQLAGELRKAALGQLHNEYLIGFSHPASLFGTALDPSAAVERLKGVGEIADMDTEVVETGGAAEGEPSLRWSIRLRTNESVADIRALLGEVGKTLPLEIASLSPEAPEAPEAGGGERGATRLGEILVEEGSVSAEDVAEALGEQKKLGDILLTRGKVDEGQVEKALETQRRRRIDSLRTMASPTLRVDIRKLDGLVNLVGEMAIIHSMFQQKILDAGAGVAGDMEGVFSQLQGIGKEIQEGVMSLRMIPVGEVFSRFNRLVRELSTATGKSVELVVEGEDTELDKSVIEKITDPLVHLIRNAVDHGIETIDERIAADKTLQGRILLRSYQVGDTVYIEVDDDGRGLDRGKIAARAEALGLIRGAKDHPDEDIFGLVFRPGFSTAEQVTGISGRGVGMDVVRSNVEQLNGRISIASRKGEGTTVTMKLPLTLAIIEGLIFTVAGEIFILPVTSVLESFRPLRENVHALQGRDDMINVRGEFIPLIRLTDLFGLGGGRVSPWEAIVVMVSHEGKRCCLLVDELLGQQQVVIKKFGRAMPKIPCISGGTILGDGSVALVVDVSAVAETTRATA